MLSHPSGFGHNIMNHLGNGGIDRACEEIFDPSKSPVVTREMVEEMANKIAIESTEERGYQERLTGEWIVFAKENSRNYYLGHLVACCW